MADKGFNVHDLFEASKVTVNIVKNAPVGRYCHERTQDRKPTCTCREDYRP